MKPVAAGAEWREGAWHNEDVDALMASASVALPSELVAPYVFRTAAAPHIAAEIDQRTIEPAHILHCYKQITLKSEAVIVEGIGGFLVPLTGSFDTADMATQLGLPVVLVVGMRLGCISQALLTAQAIHSRGLRLVGWVANCLSEDMPFVGQNVDAIARRLDAPLFGCIPRLSDPTGCVAANYIDEI